MGFTLTRNGSSVGSALPTPEQEAKARSNHQRFETMARPQFTGTDKQIFVATKSLESFLFYAFHWGFNPDDVESFLKSYQGRGVQFWIANKPKANGSGETRIAVENAIAEQAKLKKLSRRL